MNDVEFPSGGETCRAWHFAPQSEALAGPGGRPIVVMGHGFAGTRDMVLPKYAERFAAAGLGALVFDYRHFGASDGRPRQLLSIRRQLDDYAAAIRFARRMPGVDGSRVALFGTSFSGGHVVRAAADDGRVAAVVSQCPSMDGRASWFRAISLAGVRLSMRLAFLGLCDLVKAGFGAEPVRVPVFAAPGELGMLTTPDALPGLKAIEPPGFRNEVCARIGLVVGLYRPLLAAGRLRCPVLIQICENDLVAPPSAAEAAARRAGDRATVKYYPVGHFDIYLGDAFERAVADQVEFLVRALNP